MQVRNYGPGDADAVVRLARTAWEDPRAEPWTVREVRTHAARFPEGQFLVEDDGGEPVASCSSLVVPAREAFRPHTWGEITADGTFATHDPAGDVLYGADIVVRPDRRSEGVGKRLYAERRRLVRRLGLRGVAAGGRLFGYGRVRGKVAPWTYVCKVACGELDDPVLSFQLGEGFRVLGFLPAYFPDARGGGDAAHIYWPDPGRGSAAGD